MPVGAGRRTRTVPITVLRGSKSRPQSIQKTLDEIFERSANEVARQRGALQAVNIATSIRRDNLNLNELNAGTRQALEEAYSIADEAGERLAADIAQKLALENSERSIRMFAQNRVRKHMMKQKEIVQDLGSNVITGLLKRDQQDAFDSQLGSQALEAGSARTTVRHQASLNSRVNTESLTRRGGEQYTKLDPGAPGYFQGQADQLRQLWESYFGRAVMQAEIVYDAKRKTFVFTDKAMDELLSLFNKGQGRREWGLLRYGVDPVVFKDKNPAGSMAAIYKGMENVGPNDPRILDVNKIPDDVRKGFNVDRYDTYTDQMHYLNNLLGIYLDLTPSAALRQQITDGVIQPRVGPAFVGEVKAANGADDLVDSLKPVVGTEVDEATGGYRKLADTLKYVSQTGFDYLGAMPEDSWVRMPFYSRVYNRAFNTRLQAMIEQTLRTKGENGIISGEELGKVMYGAHKDAVRETKRYLYTIERRTVLGDAGEKFFPFISAGQNAIQAVGRLATRDPSSAAMIAFLWSRPYASGDIVNEDNEISLAWMEPMLPDWLPGKGKLSDVGISLGSVNVLFPETGYGLVHRPGPLVTVPASEMMKAGWIVTPYAPEIMRRFLPDEVSEEVWQQMQNYVFSDRGGPFENSLKAVLPAYVVKATDLLSQENSKAYSYTLDSLVRQKYMEVWSGEREMPADGASVLWDEARSETNGWFITRMAFNLLSPTSPQLDPIIEPLVDEYRHYQQQYGLDGDRLFIETYGPALAMLANTKGSQAIAGVDATSEAVRRAKKYAGLVEFIAPELAEDPSILGAIINDPDPNSEYVWNPSANRWQEANTIPGLGASYREKMSPQESLNRGSIAAGWTEWIKFNEDLEVVAFQRGLASASRDPELMNYKKQKLAQMLSDPKYNGWGDAYREQGSSRKERTLRVMRKVVSSNSNALEFQMDPANEMLVIGFQEYLSARDQMRAIERETGKTLGAQSNVLIANQWHNFIDDLNMRNPTFARFFQRYLYGDRNAIEFEGVNYQTYMDGVNMNPNMGELQQRMDGAQWVQGEMGDM